MLAEALPGFDLLPRVSCRVYGIDPSSKRIAVAGLEPNGAMFTSAINLPPIFQRVPDFAAAHRAQLAFLVGLPKPDAVFLEEPFVPRNRREAPTHLLMYGVTLSALGEAWGEVPLVELGVNVWKCAALGKGRGFATKGQVLDWAKSAGFETEHECSRKECKHPSHDSADALGIAAGGAVLNPDLRL